MPPPGALQGGNREKRLTEHGPMLAGMKGFRFVFPLLGLLTCGSALAAADPPLLSSAYAKARTDMKLKEDRNPVPLYRTSKETVRADLGALEVDLRCTAAGLIATGQEVYGIDLDTFTDKLRPAPRAQVVQALNKVGVQADARTGRVTLRPGDVLRCEAGRLWTKVGAVGRTSRGSVLDDSLGIELPAPRAAVRAGQGAKFEAPPIKLEWRLVSDGKQAALIQLRAGYGSLLREIRLTQGGRTRSLGKGFDVDVKKAVPVDLGKPFTLNFLYNEDKAGKDQREAALTYFQGYYTTWAVR